MHAENPSEIARTEYGNLARRFWALVIDLAVLSMIFFPVTKMIKGVWIMSRQEHLWGFGWMITDPLCLIFLGVIFGYFVILEGFVGATIGKRLTGLKVTRRDGGNTGLGRALVRNLLRLVDGLPAFNILGVVLILKSPERARFGDRIAGTRVVVRH